MRWVSGIATTDDVTRRGDRLLLNAEAVRWPKRAPLLFADRAEAVGSVFLFRRTAGALLFAAYLNEDAPYWPELCSGLCDGVAIGLRYEQCHRNAFGGITYDRWEIEDVTLMPPGWPRHDRGAQVISVNDDEREIRTAYRVWADERVRITPRSEVELQAILARVHAPD